MSEETGGIVSVVHDGFQISTNEGTAKDIQANLDSEPKPLDGDEEDAARDREKAEKKKRSEAAAELGKAGGKAAAEARETKPEPKETEQPKEEPKAEVKPEGEDKPPSPRHDARARIQQLARERAEERSRNRELEERLARLEAGQPRLAPAAAKAEAPGDDRPKPDQFENYEEYVEALTEHKMEQRIKRLSAEASEYQKQQAQVNQIAERVDGFLQKVSKTPDVIERVDPRLAAFEPSFTLPPGTPMGPSNVIADEIISSEIAPELLMYLTEHEDEVRRILSLPDARSISRAMAQLEFRLKPSPGVAHTSQTGSVETVSFAKPPVRPLSTTSAPTSDEELSEDADFDTYARVMNARDARRRRGR